VRIIAITVPPSLARTLWPAVVGGLAVFYAAIGDGAWPRRSAIAWMMGAWGARLAVQGLYTRAVLGARSIPGTTNSGRTPEHWRRAALLLISAVVCSLPAWLAASNRDPELSWLELAACVLWLVGFGGETTADRQRLRALAGGDRKTSALGGDSAPYSPRIDRWFTALVWAAFTLFGVSAAWR
jgi:steroid 5-alpha reductase family enzyme